MSAVIAGDQKMPDRDHNIASHSSSEETLNLSPDSILVYGRLGAHNLLPVTRAVEQESILRLEQNQASSFGSRQHHELRLDTLEGQLPRLMGQSLQRHIQATHEGEIFLCQTC